METLEALRTRPLKPGFGAEILDVDLKTASPEEVDQVVDAFHRFGAILLRDQDLDPAGLKAFLGRFGALEGHTQKQFTLPDHPEIYILSNKVVDGKPIGAHNDGVGWHTDYSYKAEPVMCTMLYAVEVPDEGSDTLLADLCAAYDALPKDKRARLDGLKLHHSYEYFMTSRQFLRVDKLSPELKAENPDVIHPLIRTHPADGRKALWVSTGTVKEVVGMPNPEGLDLLEELVAFVTQERFVHAHKWRVGDILIWDNRCTLHTGTLYDDKKYTRLMHRMWVKGDRPF
ncbi:TauD/TfdA dioxygenase family protein [Nitrospirillum iridis]|uniref:Taurine dioxygenase n=1 Tax=Nitrospirillum iridis TaxID=765888 RepID=A0A7X0AXK9_9PROT|nr:TauD/TfdA family dioxygenase [Nitrospirillum iridis]MBB6251988.1 taurine dioxygenase [Nitrospirillum iridis]